MKNAHLFDILHYEKMFSKEAALLKQIDESRQAIRQKHFQLKQGLQDVQDEVSKVFKPIVKPLHEMASKMSVPKMPIPKRKEKIYHSTPCKKLHKSNLSSFQEDQQDESEEETEDDEQDDTSDFKTITDTTINFDNKVVENKIKTDKNLEDFLNLLESDNYEIDTKFGVRKDRGKYMIGSSPIIFADGKIFINEKEYLETPGLLELLFRKKPRENIVDVSDIKKFQEIALETNLMRKDFKPNRSFVTVKYDGKYLKYLKPINPGAVKNSRIGKGLPNFMISRAEEIPLDYKYWDDPNELVDRLKLLVAERSAGNNNHDNEILAIVEELREAKIIY